MSDIQKAKSIFQDGGYSCVFCKGDVIYTSKSDGISPLVDFLTAGTDLNGFSAADKIVGKAAAMLFILAGVKEVYAAVISEYAVNVFERHNIKYSYNTRAAAIKNRIGTGLCPMEQAVKDIDEPKAAFEAVKQTLSNLKLKQQVKKPVS